MIKRLFFIAVLLITGWLYEARAQVNFSIAVKAGANISKVDFKSYFKPDFHVGLAFLVKILKIGIQPEALFSRQGYIAKADNTDLRYQFNYVYVPVIFKFYPFLGLNVQCGPQVGFAIGGQGEVLNRITGVKSTIDAKELVEDLDVGLVMGLGWDLPFGLTVDARYNMGLRDVLKDVEGIVSGKGKSRVIQVSVGYKFLSTGKKN